MCRMLLSVNPEHVENILNGSKKYEFRKNRCKREVSSIVIYSTSPQSRVVAEVKVEDIIEGNVLEVWRQTSKFAGISFKFFQSYYRGKKKAVAYKLGAIRIFEQPKLLSDYGVTCAPQSFVYID